MGQHSTFESSSKRSYWGSSVSARKWQQCRRREQCGFTKRLLSSLNMLCCLFVPTIDNPQMLIFKYGLVICMHVQLVVLNRVYWGSSLLFHCSLYGVCTITWWVMLCFTFNVHSRREYDGTRCMALSLCVHVCINIAHMFYVAINLCVLWACMASND